MEGEPPEIFPFLGSSRLEEPLNRYPVAACLPRPRPPRGAGGAHPNGVPVYNVAMPLLAARFPGQPPVRVFEVPAPPP